MRQDKVYTIHGHKKYKTITLHPATKGWEIWFDGAVGYNQNRFTLNQALQHVETWRRQYEVVEECKFAVRHRGRETAQKGAK